LLRSWWWWAGIYDIRYRRIPNWLVLPAVLVGFALNAFLYGLVGLKYAGLGFGVAVLIYMPLYALHGMGAGDVKLAAALGAFVGWQNWVILFILSGLIGGVLALVLMLTHGRFRKTLWNTAYILWEMMHFRAPHQRSEELDVKSPRAFTLPHGAMLALGTLGLVGARAFVAG
jgi:Flp pilus assembly protein, protease CpaA